MAKSSLLPDLARYRCSHFLVRGRIPIQFGSVPISEIIGRQVTLKRPFLCEEGYTLSEGLHYARAEITRRFRQAYQLGIHIDCLLGEEEEIAEPTPVSQLVQLLAELRFESELSYDIVFTLGRKASQMFFPLKLPLLTGTVVDEFRGFRGIKREGRKIAYELSMESPDLKELHINVEMTRREVFNADLLAQTIREAASIVAGIVPESNWS